MLVKAQVSSESSKLQEINEIKWSENVVYAELLVENTHSSDWAVLEQQSLQILIPHVMEFVARYKSVSKQERQMLRDLVEEKCYYIRWENVDVIRVFAYVKKEDIGFTTDNQKKEDLKTQFIGRSAGLVDENRLAMSDAEVQRVDSLIELYSVEISDNDAESEVQIPTLCRKMYATKTFSDLLAFLSTEKLYEKLIYGNRKSMIHPENCYVVIVDKASKDIVAILDKGKDVRMNFVSQKLDHLDNYMGINKYSAVLVQEIK